MLILLLIVSSAGFYACKKDLTEENQDDKLISDENTVNAFKKDFGFNNFDALTTSTQKEQIILSAKKISKSFNDLSSLLNLNNVRLFENKNEGITIVVFPYLNSENKSLAFKGFFSWDHFKIINEIYVEKIKNEGKTITLVSKDNDYFLINSSENLDILQNIDLGQERLNIVDFKQQLKVSSLMSLDSKRVNVAFDDKYGNHGGNGFCQRERNETFAQCYEAEKEEFCSDIFTCLAADLSPAVSILIAALCSCSANQSD